MTDLRIPLPDGLSLAARLWLPSDLGDRQVPAVFEFQPYRKSDWTAQRDELRHKWFAEHGYAAIRADLRGSGDSEGLLLDEYLPSELADAAAVIEWVAAQPWSSGAVAMFGKSWSGFNGLQVAAAEQPAALKAVVSLYSTDDRFADDIHWIGGLPMGNGMLSWSAVMFAWNARPPTPAHWPGGDWKAAWARRLEQASEPWVHHWLAHPSRDCDYWRQGSICHAPPGAVQCPVLLVGGWADGYKNAVPRMLRAGVGGAGSRALLGPWSHDWPDAASPGPQIGFLQECKRFLDRHLTTSSSTDVPVVRAYLRHPLPRPRPMVAQWPGEWVAGDAFPTAEEELEVALEGPAAARILTPLTHGLQGGTWCCFGAPDLPGEQRGDDALAETWTSAPLAAELRVLGAPVVAVSVSVAGGGQLAARLCCVDETGQSQLVSRGGMRLPREPGRVELRLDDTGFIFPAGARVRVALANAYWPLLWPSARRAALDVEDVRLRLPLTALPAWEPDFGGPPETAAPLAVEERGEYAFSRRVEHDQVTHAAVLTIEETDPVKVYPGCGTQYAERSREEYTVVDDDPLSCRVDITRAIDMTYPGEGVVAIRTRSAMGCTVSSFQLEHWLEATCDGEVVYERRWSREVGRQ